MVLTDCLRSASYLLAQNFQLRVGSLGRQFEGIRHDGYGQCNDISSGGVLISILEFRCGSESVVPYDSRFVS